MYAAASVSHSIFLDSSGAAFTCGKGRGLLGHGDSKIKTVPTRVQSLEVSRSKENIDHYCLLLVIFEDQNMTVLTWPDHVDFTFFVTGHQDSPCCGWCIQVHLHQQ